MIAPSASYNFTVRLRIRIRNRPGILGRVASAIGEAGGVIGAVDLVETTREQTARDIIPSVFNKNVAPAVAGGVARAVHETAVARRRRRLDLSGIR